MIDNFALALSHGLLIIAAWRLMSRDDLDDDDAPAAKPKNGFAGFKRRNPADA